MLIPAWTAKSIRASPTGLEGMENRAVGAGAAPAGWAARVTPSVNAHKRRAARIVTRPP